MNAADEKKRFLSTPDDSVILIAGAMASCAIIFTFYYTRSPFKQSDEDQA